MEIERIGKLTERQRECLRLVLRHYTSKEMARELGIGVDAVDQRLKGAMKKLGVATRLEAARMLADYEGESHYRPAAMSAQPAFSNRRPARSIFRALSSALGLMLPRSRRSRVILGACLAGLLFGDMSVALPVDLYLRDRNVSGYLHATSGHVTSVEIDRKSVEALGPPPWPRRHLARILRQLEEMGAAKVVCFLRLDRRMNDAEDRELARQIRAMRGRVVLTVEPLGNWTDSKPLLPLPEFRSSAALAVPILVVVLGTAREVPLFWRMGPETYPVVAMELANESYRAEGSWMMRLLGVNLGRFPIDYTLDARTIPSVSAVDVLAGSVPEAKITGKTVLLSASHRPESYRLSAPGVGEIGQARAHIIAAETLLEGVPTEVPWTATFALAVILVIIAGLLRSACFSVLAIGSGMAIVLALPSLLFPYRIYIDVTPALFLMMLVGATFATIFVWRRRTKHVSADTAAQV